MSLKLVMVNCPICGSSEYRPTQKLNGHWLAQCNHCNFKFANPRPEESSILRAYTQSSVDEELSFAYAYDSDSDVDSNYSWTGTYVLDRFLKRVPGGSFLDIGAGQGWAVSEALKRGYDAWGYEFGDARAFENSDLKERIFRTENQIALSGKKFDLMFLSAVLEHVYRPLDFLKYWTQHLKPDGFFCLSGVPNANSIFIRMKLDDWDGNIPFHHLNYFTPYTLTELIRRSGGRTVEMYTMGAPLSSSLASPFLQKRYEESFWGDNAIKWRFAKKAPAQFARVQNKSWLRLATAVSNHLIRCSGMGANLYATFAR